MQRRPQLGVKLVTYLVQGSIALPCSPFIRIKLMCLGNENRLIGFDVHSVHVTVILPLTW